MKTNTVYGIVSTRSDAEELVFDLLSEGFVDVDISVLLPEVEETRIVAVRDGTREPAETLGVLAGMGLHALSVPGFGPLFATGPITTALRHAVTDSSIGSMAKGLTGLGIANDQAVEYEEAIDGGQILVGAHTDDTTRIDLAKLIFMAAGAQAIFACKQSAPVTVRPEAPLTPRA